MLCQNCGKKNDSDAVFCVGCSHPLHQICHNCNTQNTGDARYCKKCGETLDQALAIDQSSRLKALRDSASENLQEKLRLAETEIEGQRKPVTILFADIANSTAIAEKLDPEEWKEVVQGAHHRVSEAVHRYEGTIAQLLGDGVLAFFGAPLTHEDDPERAVRAALDLQESIARYRESLKGFVEEFHMRVGIHSGEVVVGPVSADGHIEYLALGDAVNLAARLEQAAEPAQILISRDCARFIEHAFDLGDFKPVQAKGKSKPLQTTVVRGLKAEPGLARGLGGVRTPFVGRITELAQMQEAISALCQGQGGIITLVGEAGIGKSRLLEEVRQTTRQSDRQAGESLFDPMSIRWLEGRALSYGGSLSFWTIRQLLLADLGLSEGTSQVKIKAALRSRIGNLFVEQDPILVLPYLAHLMGLPLGDQEGVQIKDMDGEAIKYQALQYLREYFQQAAEETPMVLVFEDLHWTDPSSLEALERLVYLVDLVPIVFMLLMRFEREHNAWALKTAIEDKFPHRTTEIELRRLDDQESQLLVQQLLRPEVIPENVRQLILTRSEGNPFYLEEVVRHLLESGFVVEQDGEWISTEGLDEIGVPETLQGVLLARIDRLEEDVRDTLQMAAVIGRSFLYIVLEAITEAEQALEIHLSQLQRMDLVREKTRLPDLEYIFKHALTQEAAYNSLLVERRKVFHRKVGNALERLFQDREEEFLGLLGHHFHVAGAKDKAVDYLIRAGDKARLADAHDEAIDFYQEAVPLLQELNDPERSYRLWLDIGLSYHIKSQYQRSIEAYKSAHQLIETIHGTKGERSESVEKPGRQGGTLRLMETSGAIKTYDPGKIVFELFLVQNMFSGLTRTQDMWSVKPHLAWSWDISDDGMRYTFYLHKDAIWSDGTPITADQFVWSWRRNLDPSGGCHYAYMLDDVVGAREFRLGLTDDPNAIGIRAIDPLTLEIQLCSPANYFPYITALPVTFPLPHWVITEHGEQWWRPETIVTSGPFYPTRFDEEVLEFARNTHYTLPNKGNVDLCTITLIARESPTRSRQIMQEAFHEGEIDLAPIEMDSIPEPMPDTKIVGFPNNSTGYLFINPSLFPTDNPIVRRAIAMAIDLDRMDPTLLYAATPAYGGLVHPRTPGHSPGIRHRPDAEEARRILNEAGLDSKKGGITLNLAHIGSEPPPLVPAIASQLKQVLDVNVNVIMIEDIEESISHHLCFGGWIPDYPDPDGTLRRSALSRVLENSSYQEEKFRSMVDRAVNEIDRNLRLSHFRAVDHWMVVEETLFIPLWYSTEHPSFIRSNIKNMSITHNHLEDIIIED